MNELEFSSFINRSSAFQAEVSDIVSRLGPARGVRFVAAFQSGLLALEHSTAALQLINSGFFASGIALYRSQFESLVRGIWLLHAASDLWVEKLSQPLTMETASKANEGLSLAEMLVHLEKKEDAPAHIVIQLQEFKQVTWKALNSYTHGGLHPLNRTFSGYPVDLLYNGQRNSNALTALTAQLMAILSGNLENMEPVRSLHKEFIDCLPITNAK